MDDARSGGDPLKRSRLPYVALVLLTVVSLVVGVILLVRGPQLAPYEDPAARQEVRSVAEQFAAAINTYDVTKLDPYVKKVKPLLTDDLAEQFEASTQDLLANFAETKIVSKGSVNQVAISSMDADSAQTLASITVTTLPENLQFGQPRLRWRISLVKENGKWLVDNFANVTVEAEAPSDEESK
ncbi:MAG TPA: hypothetical protein PLQ19_08020 [Aeromicrobium sp.]|nr:hypothetical protein [Aeromicrobium sp.]